MFCFFLNLQFPAKNFWGRCNALQVIDFRKQHPCAARRATLRRMGGAGGGNDRTWNAFNAGGWMLSGAVKPGKDGSASYLPCFLVYLCSFKWSWEAGYHVLPWLTMISKSYLVFISLSQWWFRPVRGCMFMPISRCFTTNTHTNHLHTRMTPTNLGEVSLRVANINTWNPKQPFRNGCFNWMIPNLYIENGWKSPNIHF